MKKIILFLLMIFTINLVYANASFSDWLYCDVLDNGIRVSLSNKYSKFTCGEYIQTLNGSIYTQYSYIERLDGLIATDHSNRLYWQNLKKEKLDTIVQLSNTMNNITKAVDSFETNLLGQVLKYMMDDVYSYMDKLDIIKENTTWLELSSEKTEIVDELHDLIDKEILQVTKIKNSQNIDLFIDNMLGYFYIKKEIEWKLELLAME